MFWKFSKNSKNLEEIYEKNYKIIEKIPKFSENFRKN